MTPAEARFKRLVFWLEDAGVKATPKRLLTALGSMRAATGTVDWEGDLTPWVEVRYPGHPYPYRFRRGVEPGGPNLNTREAIWRREAWKEDPK